MLSIYALVPAYVRECMSDEWFASIDWDLEIQYILTYTVAS